MSITSPSVRAARMLPPQLRCWRSAVGAAAVAGGAAVIAGCCLPWAEAFAGLIGFPGIASLNGRLLAAAGAVMVLAGAAHLVRGSDWSRWTAGLAGCASLGFAAWLLLRLTATVRSLGSDDMVILRSGPGLWVAAAGALAAFGTLFLPPSAQRTLRAPAASSSLAAWAADPGATGLRRVLQLGLGVIWLLDAALQFQPFMFGRGFVTAVIEPAAMGSPAALAQTVTGTGSVILAHPAVFNAAFAAVQLLIGLALLSRRTAKAGLAGSVAWGLAVWWLGEALGGLLSGMASPLTGAPGAALLYAVIAVLAWPRREATPAWTRLIWAGLWGGFAALMLQPHVVVPSALGGAGAGGHVPVLIACAFALTAAGIYLPARARRLVLVAAAGMAAVIWVAGESLGQLTSGSATDPNTGPLLLLLAVAYWPSAAHRPGRDVLPEAAHRIPLDAGDRDAVRDLERHPADRG